MAKTVEVKGKVYTGLGSEQSVYLRPEPLNKPNAYVYSGGLNSLESIYPSTQFNIGNDGADVIGEINGGTITAQAQFTQTGSGINTLILPEYADNAAALGGGLVANMLYQTAGAVKVVV